jgi:hypothetical protein
MPAFAAFMSGYRAALWAAAAALLTAALVAATGLRTIPRAASAAGSESAARSHV